MAVTAAHCLAAAEAGKLVRIRRGESVLRGRIGKVFRNPAYQEPRFPQLMGTDNAIVSLHVDPDGEGEAGALEGIRAVGVATGPIPSPAGQRVVVHIPDQYGKEHVIPAGNFSNPKMLTWGPKFHPVGGDSGSGVFVLRDVPGAKPAPILIGVVVGADDRGGGASLIHGRHPWVVQSLKVTDRGRVERSENGRSRRRLLALRPPSETTRRRVTPRDACNPWPTDSRPRFAAPGRAGRSRSRW